MAFIGSWTRSPKSRENMKKKKVVARRAMGNSLPVCVIWSGVSQLVARRNSKMLSSTIVALLVLLLIIAFFPWLVGAQGQLAQKTVRFGFISCQETEPGLLAWSQSGGAVSVAFDRINSEQLLSGFNFTFEFYLNMTECIMSETAGDSVQFMRDLQVDAVFGPQCSSTAITAGTLSTYYVVPTFTWGLTTSSVLADNTRFPYVTTVIANTLSLGYIVVQTMHYFQWTQFAVIYSDDSAGFCTGTINDLEIALNDDPTLYTSISYKRLVTTDQPAQYSNSLLNASHQARVFVVCMPSQALKRDFMLRVFDMGMITNDYVYIFIDVKGLGFGVAQTTASTSSSSTNGYAPIWVDATNQTSNRDNDALTVARLSLVIDADTSTIFDIPTFNKAVLDGIRGWPFYCNSAECQDSPNRTVATFARHLHDAVYMWGLAANRSLAQDPVNGIGNGTMMLDNVQGSFQGATGEVVINENGTRDAYFFIYALTSTDEVATWVNLSYVNSTAGFVPLWANPSQMWAPRGGQCPLTVPICGFYGNACPLTFWELYLAYIVVSGVLLICLLIIAACLLVWFIRTRREELERQNREWQINFSTLQKISSKPKKGDSQSSRSLLSGPSTNTNVTIGSKLETKTMAYYYLHREPVVATKHQTRPQIYVADAQEFRNMRKLDNENLNRFIGLSIDGPQYLSIWRYCSRGSLSDVLTKSSVTVDAFFMFSLIRDVANGLGYIHSSFLTSHGYLTSTNGCLVDERYQVKISDFGLRSIRSTEKVSKMNLLWTAPELLRDSVHTGSKSSDIYSFAIICSEVLTRRSAWDLEERKESLDEILYLIKKGNSLSPMRPQLFVADQQDMNPALLHLVRDCWSERPEDRPNIETVRSLLRNMLSGTRQQNLMDHVFDMLEQYATTLEGEVEERTKELVEEKKKSDILLYRMLPKQVADRLKMGQTVEPESFEAVTVFFSDVVRFTDLAAKCTPIQVVNLLNDLYTAFDTIVEDHGVYKVESIGDGYLCVSGLPHRNGDEHASIIADMSLSFMEATRKFRIPHLPDERMQLRIGVHTGACVAGVVGLTMPRYCLFGDTVNTASRMESNGKAGMIHLSAETNQLLDGFRTESRGEVIVKGKGVLETFWLLGRISESEGSVRFRRKIDEPPKAVVSQNADDPTVQEGKQVAMYRDFKRRAK